MTSRSEILGRVREALQGSEPVPSIPRDYRDAPRPDVDLVELFVDRVADYRAAVVRCAGSEVETRIAEALAGRAAVTPAGLPWAVAGGIPDSGQSAAELDTIAGVVTSATVAVAATGTIVLDHGPGQGRRALSLVPDLHVCVVRADQVVYGVPEAVTTLDPSRPQTWISGPSATSDIELNRVEGVHGPRNLHVIVVES